MAVIVIDSSVLLGLLDSQDAQHAVAAAAVRERRAQRADFLVPAVVLAEVLVGAARAGGEQVVAGRAQVVAAFGEVRPVDGDVAEQAARLRAAHRALRMPDALVLATGVVDHAAEILTCDGRWSRYHSRVVVLG